MQDSIAPIDVSRETTELLTSYMEFIRKWTGKINLVAASQVDHLWDRHILDSYQIVQLVADDAVTITDLGSGGGLPGLVLAIHAKAHVPNRSVRLIESDQRKAAFLRSVIRELDLNASVHPVRIEDASLEPADVVTARALASLDDLLALAQPLLKPGGTAIFPKGRTASEELETARAKWQFTCQEVPSLTQNDARILVIKDICCGISRS